MSMLIHYARLSEAVYELRPKDPDDPDLRQVGGWTLKDHTAASSKWLESLQAGTYDRAGERVIVFKGTANMGDGIADAKLWLGINARQFSQAMRYVVANMSGGPRTITLCGHSLGGAIAQTVGNRMGLRFVTFNAPGVGMISRNFDQMAVSMVSGTTALRAAGATLSAVFHPREAWADLKSLFYTVNGVNFRHGADAVGNIGVHYGKVIQVPFAGAFHDLGSKHSISSFIETLRHNPIGGRPLNSFLN